MKIYKITEASAYEVIMPLVLEEQTYPNGNKYYEFLVRGHVSGMEGQMFPALQKNIMNLNRGNYLKRIY